jgi:multimeric flavodoxin WrbA
MGKEIIILGVSGSPRNGATAKATKICLAAAEEVPGVKTEFINLANKRINCCLNCNACLKRDDGICVAFKDDFLDEYAEMYVRCDGLILASPIYEMGHTGLLANFISRVGRPSAKLKKSGIFDMRFGGSIAVGGMRNGGQDTTLSVINRKLQTMGMNVVGGGVQFYNGAAVWSKNKKDFDDEKGVLELQVLGRKIAYLTKAMRCGVDSLKEEIQGYNYAGFLTSKQLEEAYNKIGM